VTLNRGAQRVTLTCAGGRLRADADSSDDQKAYDTANTQSTAHQAAARGGGRGTESRTDA